MSLPLIGVSNDISMIKELISNVAPSGLNVVITGESGVGKEVVAQQLYKQSPRADKPFIKVNCAALPETLLESELFGHTQGAFTGAVKNKRGKFELSQRGTLMLDEIGDMPFSLQAKLLRALQSGEIVPLGSEKEVTIDSWVIAITNQELEKQIARQRFREDLYYRLNTIGIHVSPLRERPEDIPVLIDYYVKRYASKYSIKAESVNAATKKALSVYSWPGNVRELQNILKRILVLGDAEKVIAQLKKPARKPTRNLDRNPARNLDWTQDDSESETGHHNQSPFINDMAQLMAASLNNGSILPLKEVRKKVQDRVEKEAISEVLNDTGWNRTKAAQRLKISYKTLLHKIAYFGMSPAGLSQLEFPSDFAALRN